MVASMEFCGVLLPQLVSALPRAARQLFGCGTPRVDSDACL